MKILKKQLLRIIKEEMATAGIPLDAIVGALTSDEEEGRNLGHSGEAGEAKMTRAQLAHIQQDAGDLADMLNDDDELPEWMQSSLAVIEAKLMEVAGHLEYKIHRKED